MTLDEIRGLLDSLEGDVENILNPHHNEPAARRLRLVIATARTLAQGPNLDDTSTQLLSLVVLLGQGLCDVILAQEGAVLPSPPEPRPLPGTWAGIP